MQTICVTVFLLASAVCCEAISYDVLRSKRATYTMVDYICHKQPSLSICTKRGLRSSPSATNNKLNADPYDFDPMPTPGPLPLGELKSAYDVVRRREQEEPGDTDKSVQQEKAIRTRVKVDDDDMLTTEEPATEITETTTTNEEQTDTTTPNPEQDQTTVHSLNPRLRYQQYEKALQEYYNKYPNYQQWYGQQQQYYNRGHNSGYYYNPNDQNYYYPQQQYYQNSQPNYYPQQQQQYYQNSQPNYYQPNGFNFGIGSQLQIPFAGPLGISTGFGFGGK
ncbi:hypothetical protein M3Y97_00477600 [Aphelenchoides bicaudatus]|nr:hypothetical protein M3Y97_00477600 [Aphelenchoides bicaudatus]